MNPDQIQDLISGGENSAVEFKEDGLRPDALAKQIVAFANTSGGIILIGVSDSGELTGIQNPKTSEEWIMNIARNNVVPPILLNYETYSINNKTVAAVIVPKGKDKPYQTSDNKFILRVCSTNRQASLNELMRLFQQSGVYHFDSTAISAASVNNLNHWLISSYFNLYKLDYELLNEDEKLRLLQNTDIISENHEPTVAGMMVFGLSPNKYLHMSGISFAKFAGNEISSQLIDKQVIDGALSHQIDTVSSIIRALIQRPSEIVGNIRKDTTGQYSDKVFRELIVNACCHRNYSISGSRVRIFLFDNRLEIISPGRLPNSVSIEKLKAGVSYAVNPVIVKFMENLGYIDKLGRGLPMVWMEAQKLGKELIFEEIGEEFKLSLYL
jgi:ATP-dependent DNA helicase RecG